MTERPHRRNTRPPAKPMRIQFAANDDDLATLDRLGAYFGGIDRPSVLRIAVKRLSEDMQAKLRQIDRGEEIHAAS